MKAQVIGAVIASAVIALGWVIKPPQEKPGATEAKSAKEADPLCEKQPADGQKDWVPPQDLKTWLKENNPRVPWEIKEVEKQVGVVKAKLRRAHDHKLEVFSMLSRERNVEVLVSRLDKLFSIIDEVKGHVDEIDRFLEAHIRTYFEK